MSSHASAPSSHASFQKATIHFTASIVPFPFKTTLFPLGSVSVPPNVQVSGYVQAGASPNVWPRVCPTGLPFFLSATPILRYSSSVRGGSDAPTSANHDRRYAMRMPPVPHGSPSHRAPARAAASLWG